MKKMSFVLSLIIAMHSSFSQSKKDTLVINAPDTHYQNSRDSIGAFTNVDILASFPEGESGWKTFLFQTLNIDDAIKDLPKKKKHYEEVVMVQFIVCSDGTVCEVKAINNVLPSAKNEAERVIKMSGNWIPATINGKAVKSYRKQPIMFKYDEL